MPTLSQARGQTRWLRVVLPVALVILVGGVVAASVIQGLGAKREEAVLPAGSALVASLQHTVSTEHAAVGDAVTLETVEPVVQDGQTVVPAGAEIRAEVPRAKDGGRIAGAPELTLRFPELGSDGETYRLDARPVMLHGTNDVGKSAAEIGGGAVAVGILGGVLGPEVRADRLVVAGPCDRPGPVARTGRRRPAPERRWDRAGRTPPGSRSRRRRR